MRAQAACWLGLCGALGLQFYALAQQPAPQLAQPPAVSASAATPSAASAGTSAAFTPEQIAQGRKVYGVYCTRCHGINMVASSPAFFDLRTFPEDAKERFIASVANGIRAMPAWKDALKPEEMDNLWAYVISNKPK